MAEIYCSSCGLPNRAELTYCTQCGAVLASAVGARGVFDEDTVASPTTATAPGSVGRPARRGMAGPMLAVSLVGSLMLVAGLGVALFIALKGSPNSAPSQSRSVPSVTLSPSAAPSRVTVPTPTKLAGALPGAAGVNWQSKSGNLRCAYFVAGSLGPSVACLDAATDTLVRLNTGLTRVDLATASQRAQLPGGPVEDFGDPTVYFGDLPGGSSRFGCWQSDAGMQCQDLLDGAWFAIRRGYVSRG